MRNLNKILLSIVFLGCLVSIFLSSVSLANGGLRDWIRDDTINNFLYCNDPSHVGRQGTESGINYTCVDTPGLGWQRVSAEASVNFQPVAGFGRGCTTNWGDCSKHPTFTSSTQNILQGLESGYYSLSPNPYFNLSQLAVKYRQYWDDTSRADTICDSTQCYFSYRASTLTCANPNIRHIIPFLSPSDRDIVVSNGVSARVCTGNNLPSKAINGFASLGVTSPVEVWGCCPAGTQGAVWASTGDTGSNVLGSFACCPVDTPVELGKIVMSQPGVDSQCLIYGQGREILQRFDPIPREDNSRFGSSLGFIVDKNNSETGFRSTNVVLLPRPTTSSSQVCANRNGCTLLNDNRLVRSDRLYNEFGLECERCYEDGEAMGLDSETREVLLCDPSSPDLVKKSEAVADDITLTRSCLNSGSPGTAGFDSCKSCIEQGGVWIALGCFDPTPLGVITGIIRIVFGVAGGIALLLIIQAGLMYMGGKEGEIEKARKQLIALFTGLAVIIFSILILRVIGINVLDVLPVGSV